MDCDIEQRYTMSVFPEILISFQAVTANPGIYMVSKHDCLDLPSFLDSFTLFTDHCT